ncbi:hypothetical protein PoB_001382800 [Plakobranchus ocellatus]|uniref:Uncharacterized protein n=1 Tax=Plakobranchus ocellatus TaxID=259542 RepID=A0AAV3YYI6_9GAST|nr:hypothetical protein PoB_001382800 [Plakobranchus ocellatus]
MFESAHRKTSCCSSVCSSQKVIENQLSLASYLLVLDYGLRLVCLRKDISSPLKILQKNGIATCLCEFIHLIVSLQRWKCFTSFSTSPSCFSKFDGKSGIIHHNQPWYDMAECIISLPPAIPMVEKSGLLHIIVVVLIALIRCYHRLRVD